MEKALVFDMDGTIADLYGVHGWLNYLQAQDATPYEVAEPLYDMTELCNLLNNLKACGWKIIIVTWLAKASTTDYDNKVRVAKKEWLDRHNFPYDELHMVKYGRTKADCTRNQRGYQILIDDNANIRKGWHLGSTIDATRNIIEPLKQLLH